VVKIWNEKVNKAIEDSNKIAHLMVENKSYDALAWSDLAKDAARVEKAATLFGKTPDEFLGVLRDVKGSWGIFVNDMRIKYGDRSTPEAQQKMAELEASERFHQLVSGQVIDTYHKIAGANQAPGERELLNELKGPHSDSWSKTMGFINMGNRTAVRQWDAALRSQDSAAEMILRHKIGLGQPGTMDYKGLGSKVTPNIPSPPTTKK